jgi:hypothetical protein
MALVLGYGVRLRDGEVTIDQVHQIRAFPGEGGFRTGDGLDVNLIVSWP